MLDGALTGVADLTREQLRDAGQSDVFGDVFIRDDWTTAVSNVVDALLEHGDEAVARTYFYAELRAVIDEGMRRDSPGT